MSTELGTGLPELPEGYYWQIKEIDHVVYHLNRTADTVAVMAVTIRRQGVFFSKEVVRSLLWSGRNRCCITTNRENLLRHAEIAYREFDKLSGGSVGESLEYQARKRYAGKYPPKEFL